MTWNDVKEKLLVFGEDDYVFADMFISIINEYINSSNKNDLIVLTYTMLRELMDENLINIFVLTISEKGVVNPNFYSYNDKKSKDDLIEYIDSKWKEMDYRLPFPNELFWIETISKNSDVVDL